VFDNILYVGQGLMPCIAPLIETYFRKAEVLPYSRKMISTFICKIGDFSGVT